jgi:hypothetical protein
MSARSHALADRLERGAHALAKLATGLTDEEWGTPMGRDPRAIGVVVHHVASVYPIEIQLAQAVAGGQPITGVTPADIDIMNANHARANARIGKEAALDQHRRNSAPAAAPNRAQGDAEQNRAAPASLYSDAPVTCQFVLEDHAVRHSYHHLARIRAVLGSLAPVTVSD